MRIIRRWALIWLLGLSFFIAFDATVVEACHREGDLGVTVYTTTNLRVEPAGVTHYQFNAVCYTTKQSVDSGLPYSAVARWDPAKKLATESLSGEGGWHSRWKNVTTTWSCPTDPWLTRRVYCNLVSYSGEGLGSPPDERPFSAWPAPVLELRERFNRAMPGVPALPPRDVKAAVRLPGNRVHITWAIPADQTSMNRTIGWFEVWRRPADTPGASWFAASGNLAESATHHYDRDPAPITTEYTVCASNVSGRNCAPAVRTFGYVDNSMLAAQTRATESKKLKSEAMAKLPNQTPGQAMTARPAGTARSLTQPEFLAQQVREALAKQFPQLAPKIQIAANSEAVVTLSGSVPTILDKTRVGESVSRLTGVSKVENRLAAANSPLTGMNKLPLETKPALGPKISPRSPYTATK